ncbi:MAG: glycerophosphodiester phosphodiesterase family protein [Oscillospiraceae bacterium]|nr:glycerophosphodiester phosphodiesterase family protein [Oscillospiraceae bacterium]
MIFANPLAQACKDRGVLVAAHRGVAAGNIPCNSLPAFEAALYQGADMLETDLAPSGDGQLLVFHPHKEKSHLNKDIRLEEMTMEEISKLRFVNVDNDATDYGILTLDQFLETYKNRCFINLDHGWDHMAQMVEAVRRHKMEDQVLLKAPNKMKYVDMLEALAPEMMFMPIYKEKDEMTELLEHRNINFVGVELVFSSDDSYLASEEYIESHHAKGRVLWANPIIYYYKSQLTGGHSDDVAVVGDPENGWGWLMDKGFDILQTDWVMPLRHFINNRKK